MNTTTLAPQVANQQSATNETLPDFGQGTFSSEMLRIFKASRTIFGFESKVAERIARQAGTDAGAVYKNNVVSIKVGKRKEKDNTANIAFAAKQKGVVLTDSLNIVRAISWIEECANNNVSFGNTKWTLNKALAECKLVLGE